MSYRQVKAELEKAINEIAREASRNHDGNDCAECYAQGMDDAVNYLDNLFLLVSELADNERYEEMKNRVIPASDKQLELFD